MWGPHGQPRSPPLCTYGARLAHMVPRRDLHRSDLTGPIWAMWFKWASGIWDPCGQPQIYPMWASGIWDPYGQPQIYHMWASDICGTHVGSPRFIPFRLLVHGTHAGCPGGSHLCSWVAHGARLARRRMLQEVWKDVEERRREEEDEGECSISVTDRELWRKCFREQEALAREEAEELSQHGEYMLQCAYERLQWEKDDVARKAAKEEEERISRREKEFEEECSIPVICGVCAINVDELPFMKGWMGGQEITVLRDYGSTGVMIRAELVDASQYTGRNQRLMSITSRMEEFPVAWIQIDTPIFAGYVQALCLPNPMCGMVIGSIPGVHPEILGNSGMNTTRKVDLEVNVIPHEDFVETAEIQHVKVMKTADEVMQHEEAEKTAEDEKMQLEKVMKTAAEDALQLEMVTPDSEASYETEDGGDASEQEASQHPTDDDDEDRRMSERQERNGVTQARGPSLPGPSVRRSSKMRCSNRQDHSRKRSSDQRDRRMDGRRHSPLAKKSRFSSWARKKADGIDVDDDGGSSR